MRCENRTEMQASLRISNLSILQKETELIHTTELSVDLENRITIPGSRITLLKRDIWMFRVQLRGRVGATVPWTGN
ncbi:MAG: hypothetical protein R2874_06245 [Desulfobacterales bacterium]